MWISFAWWNHKMNSTGQHCFAFLQGCFFLGGGWGGEVEGTLVSLDSFSVERKGWPSVTKSVKE